jgi:hypothetical protein
MSAPAAVSPAKMLKPAPLKGTNVIDVKFRQEPTVSALMLALGGMPYGIVMTRRPRQTFDGDCARLTRPIKLGDGYSMRFTGPTDFDSLNTLRARMAIGGLTVLDLTLAAYP